MNSSFILENQEFWSDFQIQKNGRKILIECPSIPMITHGNALFSIILNQAKSFIPVWLINKNINPQLLKSYVPIAEFININLFSVNIIKIIFVSLRSFIRIFINRRVLSFSYDNVCYGDIIYDAFLSQEKVATISNINYKMLIIIFRCIYRHEIIKKILHKDNFEGVLVSHQVGIECGVMLRTALRYGYKGYLKTLNLQCFNKLEDVYNYQYKPFPEEIETIMHWGFERIELLYRQTFQKQISGQITKDGIYAFSPKKIYYKDKKKFLQDYRLDPNKKNIFVMLHAFNDHPHSHFKQMIFKDYYDWFIQTLEFAQKNKSVNWIFKQHPSIRFYETKDVCNATC